MEQLDTEDWKEFRKEGQALKSRQRNMQTEFVETFCEANGIDIKKNTPYHFTLLKGGFKRLDVFPTSSKIKNYAPQGKMKIVDLRKYLLSYYTIKEPLIKTVVTEQTINGVQSCIDHIDRKLLKIEDNKVHTVLTAIRDELYQYL